MWVPYSHGGGPAPGRYQVPSGGPCSHNTCFLVREGAAMGSLYSLDGSCLATALAG